MVDLEKNLEESAPLNVKVALYVNHEALDRYGRVLRHLGVGLVDQAIQVRWVSSDARIEQLALGPIQTVVHPPVGWTNKSKTRAQLIDMLSQDPPTIVHAFSGSTFHLAGTLAQAVEADFVVQVSSVADCDQIAKGIGAPISRYVTPSDPLADILRTQLAIPSEHIEIIRPGTLASPEIACFAHPDAMPTLLCTAPLRKDSGVKALIEAIGLIHAKGIACLVFLLGAGSEDRKLRQLVRDLKLESVVTFARFLGDPLNAMQGADFYVQPSWQDGFYVDTLQAMAAGTLLITAANPSCDHITHGQTAIVCEKMTAQTLADTIEQFLADRPLVEKYARAARDYVKTHHAVSTMAELTSTLYRTLAMSRATFSFKE